MVSLLGKIERWMLFYGTNEFRVSGKIPFPEMAKTLKLEGFFESENGVSLTFQSWADQVQINPEDITVLTHGKDYIDVHLGPDVIPPNMKISEMPNLPKVSIITPVYNSEKFFDSYIQEISAIKYPRDLLEIIIIDDGSSDVEVTKRFSNKLKDIIPATLLIGNKENMGVFYSKMTGANAAAGSYITYWDIDDKYEPYQILLLAIHNSLLEKRRSNFLVSAPSILLSPDGKVIGLWKTPYDNPINPVTTGLLVFSGKITITSSLLHRETVLKTYKTLTEKYEVLKVIPKLSVPEDTILVNQMVLDGHIKTVYPISYTGRGHVRYAKNTSANLKRRAKEIPLSSAIGFIKLRELIGTKKLEELLIANSEIIIKSIKVYGNFSKEFVENFIKYLNIYGENELITIFFRIFKGVY